MGALSVTWDDHYRAPFAPLLPGVDVRVGRRSGRAPGRAVTEPTAAVIVEPIQGEGGVRPFSRAMADGDRRRPAAAPARCSSPTKCSAGSAAPAGRSTRRRSACEPDLMALGKALGAGVPIGAALFSERVATAAAVRRSRQHLRRQPARLPRGAGVSRGADRPRPAWRTSPRSARTSSAALRALAARHADRQTCAAPA